VLQRTRKDPIFEFTNAVADRDLSAILFFMKSLLDDGMHPLQLLAAVANQIRRLLAGQRLHRRDRGRSWSARLTFPQFKSGPFKAVQADDDASDGSAGGRVGFDPESPG
jgi:DNA polymerase-3 subunit delta